MNGTLHFTRDGAKDPLLQLLGVPGVIQLHMLYLKGWGNPVLLACLPLSRSGTRGGLDSFEIKRGQKSLKPTNSPKEQG